MKSTLLVIVLFLSANLLSQQYQITKLGIEDGLSSNYVVGISQDDQGYIWLATESGLNRFDGKQFKVFKRSNDNTVNSISGDELNSVYADHFDNKIWIATQRDGLNFYDYSKDKFSYYKHSNENLNSLPTNDITNIINSNDSNLWITTYHNGFAFFNKKTEGFVSKNTNNLPSLLSNRIWCIAEDSEENIYLGHDTIGLSIYNSKKDFVENYRNNPGDENSLPGNKVHVLYKDNTSNIWIGTNNGLALYNKQTHTFKVFRHKEYNSNSLIANNIFTICQTSDNKLWIGTENGGISILDLNKQLFTNPKEVEFYNIYPGDAPYSLSNKTIRSIFEDSFHNVWIGSYGGGINFISHESDFFNHWSYSVNPEIKDALSTKTAWGICKDFKGRIWVGTDGNGIDIFDQNKKIRNMNTLNSSLTDDAVISAFQDSKNNLWFGTFRGGVNIVKNNSDKIQPFTEKIDSDVRCFDEDKDGMIWIGTSDGVYKYNPETNQIFKYSRSNSALNENLVRCIKHDSEGNLWIGYFGEGLSCYNKDLKLIKRYDTYSGFPSNMINHIYCDSIGNIWAGTGNGLICMDKNDKNNFTVYNDNNKIDNTNICAITEDHNGNIWFSTIGGITSFDTKEKTFNNYQHTNYPMIPIGSFKIGSVAKTRDNIIYFGSENGVCFFKPDNFPSKLSLPPATITDFKVYNKNINLTNKEISIQAKPEIELDYDQNTFKISFNVLDFALNNLTDFSFRLNGLEERWYHADHNHTVTFRNIPYGNYDFQIKSRIVNQIQPQNIKSWNIKITPPFWLSWGAKFLYLVIFLGVIYLIFFFYKKKVELMNSLAMEKREHEKDQELNTERLSFFTNIAHELRTPITLILGPIEDLISSKKINVQEVTKLKIIEKSTKNLLNLINQIMEFRKTETENRRLTVQKASLDLVVKEIGLKYFELNSNKNIKVVVDIKPDDYQVFFDREVITIILDNLISNALKYTMSGTVSIRLNRLIKSDKNYIEIIVEDTGKGIDEESLPRIFERYYRAKGNENINGTGIGMALVKNLLSLHEAIVNVESEPDKGTIFKIVLDAEYNYPNALHLDNEKEEESGEEEISSDMEEEQNQAKHIVLVVEDNAEINEYIQNSLSVYYKVISAFDGKDGIEKAQKYIPDIIISDIMMPVVDGFELTSQIKNDVRTSHIPIILLTAKDSILDKTKGYQLGIDSYLTKPFSAELLVSRIANIIENRSKLAEQFNNTVDKVSFINEALTNLDKEFMEKVAGLIEENMDSADLDVKFIADHMALSHSSLYRKIKALTNLTANEYIRNIRIKKAEELLVSGKYSISEIAYMVGMSSSNYFRKCFKDVYGQTPSEYIKSLKNN